MGQVSELNTSLVGVFYGFRYIEVISSHSIIDVSLAFIFDNTPEKFPTEKETHFLGYTNPSGVYVRVSSQSHIWKRKSNSAQQIIYYAVSGWV